MNKYKSKKIILIASALAIVNIFPIDNPHFYRATNFLTAFYEPRLAWPWLTSLDASVGFGSTRTGRNGQGVKVPLLDIYGTYNMQALGINVPGKDLTNPLDIILNQLALLAIDDKFAHLSFRGKFKIIEANFSVSQNLLCGFFVQAHLPVRRLEVTDVSYVDLSPIDSAGPNINTPVWQSFLAQFPNILARYGLSIAGQTTTGVGDLSVLAGWTNNYEETQEIDYFDTTIRAGVLFPTGKKKNENQVFSIATGYNGHYAVPISLDFAVGWYDWFTIGTHIGAMTFFKKNHNLRVRTDCLQTGLIRLAQTNASVKPGALWEANAYMLADHVICGLSFLAGYSFANKNEDLIDPINSLFDMQIINGDPEFSGWKMHTINFLVDWDFSTYDRPGLPHIGFFYNIVVDGRRIFNTNVGGFEVGINFACSF